MGKGKAKEIDGCKLWYPGFNRAKNGVGILVGKKVAEQVVEVKCTIDRVMSIKLVVGSKILNIASIYAFQIRLGEDIMRLL